MLKPDYNQHEDIYQNLIRDGFKGWGGSSFERRMAGWRETVERLLASQEFPRKETTILELGSGAGDALIPFAREGYAVTGIEVSPTAVAWAQAKFRESGLEGTFLEGDISRPWPLEDGSFSAVLDGSCLHCLIGEDRGRAFREVFRVLKPGGFFLVNHMVNEPRNLGASLSYNSHYRIQVKDGHPYRSMPTLNQLQKEISKAGFKILAVNVRENLWWDHAEIWCSSR